MKFREHRGGYAESMETTVEVDGRKGLVERLNTLLKPYNLPVTDDMVAVKPYGLDDRNGWDTHIVTVNGYGVAGFTDQEI